MKLAIASCLLAAMVAASPVGATESGMDPEMVMVTLDQAKVLRIAAPAATIIIGNPSIADATMQDSQTLILTGKTYGTTNMIVLDSEGEPISEMQLTVEAPSINQVSVFRGAQRFSLSCNPVCQPSVVPGDAEAYFGSAVSQPATRAAAAAGPAGTSQSVPAN